MVHTRRRPTHAHSDRRGPGDRARGAAPLTTPRPNSRARSGFALLGLPLSALALLVQCSLGEAEGQGAPLKTEPAAPASPPASRAPASGAIPMAEVATRAAQMPDLLRTLTAPLAENAESETIRRRLHEARAQVELELAAAETILRGHPTLDVIQLQQQLWQQRHLQTSEWLTALTRRATLLQDTVHRLLEIKKMWRETREASVTSGAPAAILAQIDGVLTDIEAAEAPLTARRTAVLDLQSAVAKEVARSADVLSQFTRAQERAMGGILARDSPPVWAAEAWTNARAAMPARVRELAVNRRDDVVRYVADPSRGMPLHAAILVVLAVVFFAAGRRIRPSSASGPSEVARVTIADRPYAAALALTLLFVSAPISTVPQSLRQLSDALVLIPVIRLIRPAIDSRLVVPVYGLAVLFTLDSFRQAIGGVPVLEQAILALEMATAMAALVHS